MMTINSRQTNTGLKAYPFNTLGWSCLISVAPVMGSEDSFIGKEYGHLGTNDRRLHCKEVSRTQDYPSESKYDAKQSSEGRILQAIFYWLVAQRQSGRLLTEWLWVQIPPCQLRLQRHMEPNKKKEILENETDTIYRG